MCKSEYCKNILAPTSYPASMQNIHHQLHRANKKYSYPFISNADREKYIHHYQRHHYLFLIFLNIHTDTDAHIHTDSEVANLYDLTSDKHNYIVISEHSNCSQGCGGESSKRGMDRNVILVLSIQEASCPLTTSGLGFSVGPLAFHFQRRSPFESRTKAKTLKEEKEKEREKREEPPFISHY